jgi:hypothetical protein
VTSLEQSATLMFISESESPVMRIPKENKKMQKADTRKNQNCKTEYAKSRSTKQKCNA